ncbi:SUMF1/EgtB/PvdO family nonheme iron enzyme [Bradyrhizobium sp. AUGA SZCCT0283]|uniref:SUMF1/EgtB/PvdO family nonheme iron enzyme n=1 Tax=Bradyrhizobium sp. AUGA SZCCT0283 TaxID=2807671 RepID=UPI001BA46D81|nr:SUMF1/EgtB/PvdO family nonheme iron enzyme [Bradyrhizobium sp. AUGA SZCCT0283]MBR1279006.1 SUMF1/EgtB/PvdO family nonheme iron enzyme [Bradyrhizobium sp. AUGA SZCCT0283]
MAPKVFISYRRDDSAGHAGRVHDRLEREFGRNLLFMDVDSVPLGVNFVKVLGEEIAKCDALLAIIGPGWLDARDENGNRRLDNLNDFVRIEIETALLRGIPVIPILLEGTRVPKADRLPDGLKELALRNGVDVRHASFLDDMERLIRGLKGLQSPQKTDPAAPSRVDRDSAEGGVADSTTTHAQAGKQLRLAVRSVGFVWLGAAMGALVFAWVAADQAGVLRLWPSRPAKTASSEGLNGKVQADPAGRNKAESDKGTGVEPKGREEDAARSDPALTVEPGSGQSFLDQLTDGKPCTTCPEMVVVPAGSFMMGSPVRELGHDDIEGPQRKVTIARPVAVGKYEVTFAEWDACVADGGCKQNPDDEGWGRGKRPVINVSWDDITKEYLPWLSRRTGKTYQLLTEAEWEYAARAGSTTRFHFGNDEKDLCTYGNVADLTAKEKNKEWTVANCSDGHVNTAVVGSFKHNVFGIHDMHGNVWEWVQDCFRDSYASAPVDGSAVTYGDCTNRVVRGGSWIGNPSGVRSGSRFLITPDVRDNWVGFRLARTLNHRP